MLEEEAAQYTGGYDAINYDYDDDEDSDTTVALFFEGVPENHPDYPALGVLQALLGGHSGGLFVAGQEQRRNMWGRLITGAFWEHGHWLKAMQCILMGYGDTSLVGIISTAPKKHVEQLVKVTIQYTVSLVDNISPEEFERAKNTYPPAPDLPRSHSTIPPNPAVTAPPSCLGSFAVF